MRNQKDAEMIGKRVIDAQERRRRFVAKHHKSWEKEGKEHRKIREGLGITRREISGLIGFSETTLGAYEAGNPIMNRKYLVATYKLAIKYIQLQRREIERNL